MNGELVTTKLSAVNAGLEEFIDHSYYEAWEGNKYATDPLGNPLSPYHPWNKETKPKPGGQNWKERYSWSTAPRWDRQAFEAGAYTRLWVTAAARKMPINDFVESTGSSLKFHVPRVQLPEVEMEWRIPKVWNTFERNRARAYAILFNNAVAMNNWLKGLDYMKQGKTEVATPFEIPTRGTRIGVGYSGAGQRLADPPPGARRRCRQQLPDRDAVHDQRLPARRVGQPRPLRRGRHGTRPSSRSSTSPRTTRRSTS